MNQIDEIVRENLYAEVVLRSRTGASILGESDKITPQRIHLFQAREETPPQATEHLERAGFRVLARSRFGVSIAGPKNLFEQYFKTSVVERSIQMLVGDAHLETPAFFMEATPRIPNDLSSVAESVYVPKRGYFLAGEGAMPTPGYYALRPPADIVARLNTAGAHGRGFRGNGVRVAMIDSGFIADHDYYNGRGYQITVHAVVGQANQDEYGHGTGIAANLLAIAPSCDFHFFKMSDGIQWATLAAFRQAVTAGARVITNSWGQGRDPVLEAEIINAVATGITVVFAAGNGGPVGWPGCMPDVLSVGGAFPRQDGTWEASSYASSGTNPAFPNRHAPDLAAIVGQAPKGIFIVMPTMRGAQFDGLFGAGVFPNGDETGPADGWLVASGTSSAAPMVAGVAALLLQARSSLTPADIRQTLADTCRDVTQGASASGESAGVGPDSATGAGVIDVSAAVDRVAPVRPCPRAPITVCRPGPIVSCRPGPIVACRLAPIVQCTRAPFVCGTAPVICTRAPLGCLRAPILDCVRAPVLRCPPGPTGCLAGPVLRPGPDGREGPGERAGGQAERLVPVVVMVEDDQLDVWLAQEQAYATLGMAGEYGEFPSDGGTRGGPFDPSMRT